MSAGSDFMFVPLSGVLKQHFRWDMTAMCSDSSRGPFSDCDNLIQAGCAANLFWYYFGEPQRAGAYFIDAIAYAALLW